MSDETPLSRVRAFQRAANPNGDYHWPAEEAANVGGVPLYFDDIEALASTDELDAVEVAIRRLRETEAKLAQVRDVLAAHLALESADAAAGSYAGRAEEAEARVAKVEAERDEWIDSFDLMRAESDARGTRLEAAIARAEQAEAALTELQERLGDAEVEWAARWRSEGEEIYRSSDTEADARHFVKLWRERGVPGYVTELEVVSALIGEWQNAGNPRTALERATVEQGVQPVSSIDELTAPEDERLSDEEFEQWRAGWKRDEEGSGDE